MLDELNNIDWKQYKTGVDIPQTIQDLASDDSNKYQAAYWILQDRVLLSRTLLDGDTKYIDKVLGTNLVVDISRFLLKLLKKPTTKAKHLILYLLDNIVMFREIFDLDIPYSSRIDDVITLLCQNTALFVQLLTELHPTRIQEAIINILATCSTEKCETQEKSALIEALIEHLSNITDTRVILYLIDAVADTFIEDTISGDLREKFLRQLDSLKTNSVRDEIRKLSAETMSKLES